MTARLTASAIFVAAGAWFLSSGAMQDLLRPVWTIFTNAMSYLFI